MIIGIHQPHYFPWLGYFDKMAKSDVFILLDDVQMEKGSYMYRNRILDQNGRIVYLTISGDKHGFLHRSYKEIASSNDAVWLQKQAMAIKCAYQDSPYFDEVWHSIEDLFEPNAHTICSYCVRSVLRIKDLLGITTRIVMQSDMIYDRTKQKNDLVLELCKTLGADGYLSGNGAKKYTDESSFEKAGIRLRYQQCTLPTYQQMHTSEFIGGLSILDALFACGIKKTIALLQSSVQNGKEFEG